MRGTRDERGRPRLVGSWPCVVAAAAVSLAVSGCKLIDQRTFVANADKPPKVVVPDFSAFSPKPVGALVTIVFPSEEDDWRQPLATAVGAALARKPDAQFTLTAVAPNSGDIGTQQAALARVVVEARPVADAVVADGVDRSRLQVLAVAQAGAKSEQVRLTVR